MTMMMMINDHAGHLIMAPIRRPLGAVIWSDYPSSSSLLALPALMMIIMIMIMMMMIMIIMMMMMMMIMMIIMTRMVLW